MGFFYAAMWFIAGFILIFSLAKEHKVFYFAGGFFLLLGAWWLADAFVPEDLFAGGWGIALRIITLAALVLVSVVFFAERRKMIQKESKKSEEKE